MRDPVILVKGQSIYQSPYIMASDASKSCTGTIVIHQRNLYTHGCLIP